MIESGLLLQLRAVHANTCTDVARVVGHAYFHSIRRCSVSESVDEVLQFTIAADHKIDVVGET